MILGKPTCDNLYKAHEIYLKYITNISFLIDNLWLRLKKPFVILSLYYYYYYYYYDNDDDDDYYYYYYYHYFINTINNVSPSSATTILTFPLGKPNWVLISFKLIFLMRTESISNNCQFSFTLQTLATLIV